MRVVVRDEARHDGGGVLGAPPLELALERPMDVEVRDEAPCEGPDEKEAEDEAEGEVEAGGV